MDTVVVQLVVDPDDTWQNHANCVAADPDIFFPERGGSTREAKVFCRACCVREACLEFALNRGERFGVWGGKSERERHFILTGRYRPRHRRSSLSA